MRVRYCKRTAERPKKSKEKLQYACFEKNSSILLNRTLRNSEFKSNLVREGAGEPPGEDQDFEKLQAGRCAAGVWRGSAARSEKRTSSARKKGPCAIQPRRSSCSLLLTVLDLQAHLLPQTRPEGCGVVGCAKRSANVNHPRS